MELKKLRVNVDKLDEQLLKILVERQKLVKEINKIKNEKNIPLVQPEREHEILEKAKKLNLENIFKTIIEESKSLNKNNDYASKD